MFPDGSGGLFAVFGEEPTISHKQYIIIRRNVQVYKTNNFKQLDVRYYEMSRSVAEYKEWSRMSALVSIG